jgi:hypothetical protein
MIGPGNPAQQVNFFRVEELVSDEVAVDAKAVELVIGYCKRTHGCASFGRPDECGA